MRCAASLCQSCQRPALSLSHSSAAVSMKAKSIESAAADDAFGEDAPVQGIEDGHRALVRGIVSRLDDLEMMRRNCQAGPGPDDGLQDWNIVPEKAMQTDSEGAVGRLPAGE